MAWIELHQSLPTNRKLLRFKALLNLKTPQAVGHLCILWLWALDNAPDGELGNLPARELAQVCQWNERRAGELLDALITSGFLDRDGDSLRIHDWESYGGKYQEKREKAKQRMRQYRERSANVTHPDQIREDQTTQEKITNSFSGAASASGAARESVDEFLLARGLLPESWFGLTGELLDEARSLADELLGRFAKRQATELDVTKVLAHVTRRRCENGVWTMDVDPDRRDLLLYAFEQAAAAGKGGQWHYIEGVLEQLGARKLGTLHDAELYDLERGAL